MGLVRKQIGFDNSFDETKSLQQIEQPDIFHMCAACSELPSNISTMVNTQYCQSLSVSSNIYQISIQSLLKLGTQRVFNNSSTVGLSNIVHCEMPNLKAYIFRLM